MPVFKVHIIHVGSMSNKGAQALLKSDIHVVREIFKDKVFFSVSTTDIEGVRALNLPLNEVLPPIMDIPYEKADKLAKKFGFSRDEFKYKGFAFASLFYMFFQAIFSIISIFFVKVGLKAFYRAEVIDCMKNCDLVISCSDENFKESASLLPLNAYWILTWWSMLVARTWDVLTARSLGKPIIMFPNSIGPFRTQVGRFVSRLALNNFNCILIRDAVSYKIVESLRIRSVKILTSDTALLFKLESRTLSQNFSRPAIGVCLGVYSHSLSKEEFNRFIVENAKALDMIINRYGFNVYFLPHYVSGFEFDDLEVCKLVLRCMKSKDKAKIVEARNLEDFRSLIEQMDALISSKMHPAVLGTSGYVPTLCIAYDHKQTDFFEELGLEDYLIRLQDVSSEMVASKVGRLLKDREKIVGLLKARVPKLQEDIRKSVKEALTRFTTATE